MELLEIVRTGQNGQARQITAPEMRACIARAGIQIEYLNGRVLTRKAGERAMRWGPTWNDNALELEQLRDIATVYKVALA